MNKYSKSRNGLIHLYNPKNEGVGSYDANYINAYKKNTTNKNQQLIKKEERYVA